MESSHLTVGKVEVVAQLHRQRSLAAAAEAHDAVLAASVRHIVDCEHALASRVCLKEPKNKESENNLLKKSLSWSTRVWRGSSHHYESKVVSVWVAVICTLDLQFVSSHPTDLHLMDLPGDIKCWTVQMPHHNYLHLNRTMTWPLPAIGVWLWQAEVPFL